MNENIISPPVCPEGHYTYQGIPLSHSSFDLKWIDKYIGYPKIIMEFGSFDGGDGLRYKLRYPDCIVYSIEADPILYNRIKELNKFGILAFNYAINNINGDVPFNRCKFVEPYYCYSVNDVGGSGSLKEPTDYNKNVVIHQKYDETIVVPGITIQDFCNQQKINNVDLMHIDVEGSTMETLVGFGTIRPKMLFIEIDGAVPFYKGAPTFEQVDDMLNNMEYKLIIRTTVDSLFILKKL